jgi:hypothetical protein
MYVNFQERCRGHLFRFLLKFSLSFSCPMTVFNLPCESIMQVRNLDRFNPDRNVGFVPFTRGSMIFATNSKSLNILILLSGYEARVHYIHLIVEVDKF